MFREGSTSEGGDGDAQLPGTGDARPAAMAGWHRSRPPWQAASRRLADHGASGMRAAAYRGYARHYGRNRRARHRNRGRAASAEPRRDDPDRNRRIERLPTPRGDHVIALDSFATPAAVERPGDVIGTRSEAHTSEPQSLMR